MSDWSPSRSATWNTCRRLYWLRHIARVTPSQPVGSALMHGRLVHAGLQAAYEGARDEGAAPDAMMSVFYPYANQAIHDYTDTDPIHIRARRDAASEVSALLEALPVPAPGAILGVELPFEIVVDGVSIKGVIDLALLTSAFSVHIRDWKTGELPADIEVNPQLGTYHREARARWSFATKITVGLYNTRQRRELPGQFSLDTEAFVLDRLVSHYRDMAAVHEAARHGRRSIQDSYPPQSGSHCSRCDCRSYCPLFAGASLPVRDEAVVRQEKERIDSLIN
jgi:RecB family exonuclease